MMVNFSPDQYPAIEQYILAKTPSLVGFFDRYSAMLLLLISLGIMIVFLLLIIRLTLTCPTINKLVTEQMEALKWNTMIITLVQSYLFTLFKAVLATQLIFLGKISFWNDFSSPLIVLIFIGFAISVSPMLH